MDDSDISVSSTPRPKRFGGRRLMSDSSESDQEGSITADIVIPESDLEESDINESQNALVSYADTSNDVSETLSPIEKPSVPIEPSLGLKSRKSLGRVSRRSLGLVSSPSVWYNSAREHNLDTTETSQYLSFRSSFEDTSSEKDTSVNQLCPSNVSVDKKTESNSKSELSEIDGGDLDSSVSEVQSDSGGREEHDGYANGDVFTENADDSGSVHSGHSNNSEANQTEENEKKIGVDDTEPVNESDFDQSGVESVHSNGNYEVEEISLQGSPKRTSLIDLTQSDSLQNSPDGATRQVFQNQRDVADIVAELSAVTNDVMVKEALLENINTDSLPDNGRNLKYKVIELQKRKADLEKELHQNEEYISQKSELEQIRNERDKILAATKQTTLNFQPAIKMEARERASSYSEEDGSPESKQTTLNFQPAIKMEARERGSSYSEEDGSPESTRSHGSTTIPEWGQLPNPDMTISGFGKRAMQTHLAEKSVTLDALSKLHNALKTCPTEDTLADDPKQLRVELMPHQKHGLAWMLWREQERPSGGILADDMGLGKTLSMISLILKQIEKKGKSEDSDSDSEPSPWMSSKRGRMPQGGTLVVCPASLIAQWEREIYKRVKKRFLSVELYHGSKRETRPRRLAEYDVIITTYNLVSRESGVETAKNCTKMKEKGPLFMVKWDRIILDEAHIVRNHKSLMALGVCELVGKHKWCLTGTPIQNKELDLYALLKFLECSPFDDLVVWKKWVDNKNVAGMQRLNTMMKSLMLRRTKEQLQERGDLDCLPEKTFERIDVHLDSEELQVYEKVALFSSSLFCQFLHQRAEKQQALDVRYGVTTKPIWEQGEGVENQFTTTEELAKLHRKMKGMSEIKTHQILVLLLRLRQICCHPGLVKKMVEDGDLDIGGVGVEDASGLDVDLFNQMNNLNINESEVDEENEKEKLDKSNTMSADNPVLSFDRPSAKIRAILDLIEEKLLDSDDKAIIVSQWTSMLNVIAKFLKQLQIKFETLSGEVPVDKRQDIVNAINKKGSGPQVLLLSLTAGGVGLNLVGANHLLLVDIHWNPQLEAQACDRIYRVGQNKNVFIYRFITVNTIEERIKDLQDKKLILANNVLTGTMNTQASKLTLDDLKMLFSAPSQVEPVGNAVPLG